MAAKNRLNDDFNVLKEKCRLETFKDWGFNDSCACNAKKMAEAGFVHVSGDGVCCVVCFKELEGWEPEDDPWAEHKKHAVKNGRNCEFVKIGKKQSDLTVEDLSRLCQARQKNLAKFEMESKMADFRNNAELIKRNLQRM